MLYPTNSRVGKGKLVLTHSAPHFQPNSEGRSLPPGRRNDNAALCHQGDEIEILNISFPWMGIEPTTCRIYSHTLGPHLLIYPIYINIIITL